MKVASAGLAATPPTSPPPTADRPPSTARLDPESREWLRQLRGTGQAYDDAVIRLHALLLRAARFEVARRPPRHPAGKRAGAPAGGAPPR